ncbi:hypothetical protein [Spiroplasma endosymbiont of Polydrusus formosus]
MLKCNLHLIGEPTVFLQVVNNLPQKRRTTLQTAIKTFIMSNKSE